MDSVASMVLLARAETRSSASSNSHQRAASELREERVERVLVVDDEPLFCTFIARVLRMEGYEVLEAGTAEEALRLLQRSEPRISLLLTDVGLPDRLGPELVRRAQYLNPNLPALLMSGDPKDFLIRRGVLAPDAQLLEKPFSVATLLTRVEQSLVSARA